MPAAQICVLVLFCALEQCWRGVREDFGRVHVQLGNKRYLVSQRLSKGVTGCNFLKSGVCGNFLELILKIVVL